MNSRVVQVQVRTPYGQTRIYPMNEAARIFAEIAGRKTFYPKDLERIEALGFEIEYVPWLVNPVDAP